MVRKGRTKENVAGERYDSNAMPAVAAGMPDMSQMMEMMQGMAACGCPAWRDEGCPVWEECRPMRPKIIYVYGLAEGTPTSSFMTFYPNYIDNKKTVQQAVVSPSRTRARPHRRRNVGGLHVFQAAARARAGQKVSARLALSGRIRVRLVRDDGSPENPDIPNRKTLMIKMAELIPKLQSRKVRLEKEAEEAKKKAAAAAGAVTTSSGGGKKKGKKKGRR
ncbi:Signal recognition particle, SRP19 subunit [Phytophthora cactorum]|nr:Signal recognition particle, SRP19 subunit [Phytophthora cactorum]